jgi:hypothetical protein
MDADLEALRARREKQRKLFDLPVEQWSDTDLMEQLGERYASEPIPSCRVCGGALSIQRAGGGAATVWACSPWEDDPSKPGQLRPKAGRKLVDEHYDRSRWTQYRSGDSGVLELIRRYRAAPGVVGRVEGKE